MSRAGRKRMGLLFRKLRLELNLTQYEMGKLLRLHQTAVSRIERNEQTPDGYELKHAFHIAQKSNGGALVAFERFLYGS
jgi:transcriptional regulator with XRE-family HTH domain